MGKGTNAMSTAPAPEPEVLGPETVPVAYDANKRPAEIEEDIARTRADLSETLDALERKLAPRQLLEKGVDMLRGSMDGNLGRAGETLRANPIPLALIGAGIGWLLLSGTGGGRVVGDATLAARRRVSDAVGRAGEVAGGVASRAGDVAGRVGEMASGAAGRVKGMVGGEEQGYPNAEGAYAYARPKLETGSEEGMAGYGAKARARPGLAEPTPTRTSRGVADRGRAAVGLAGERASQYADYAGEQMYRVRDRFSQLLDEHPLAVGTLGFLAGAVLAMMLPSTPAENRTLGETRDRVLDEAQGLGREAVERARQVAGAAATAAVEATRGEVEKSGSKGESKSASSETPSPGTESAG